MRRVARINPRWVKAEYEPMYVNFLTGQIITSDTHHIPRYDTFEDARDEISPIWPYEFIYLP